MVYWLYYFGARYYDAKLSRWISTDPVWDGLDLYGYCGNRPVNFIDPNGMYGINRDGSITINDQNDQMNEAAKMAGWGDNWHAAAASIGAADRYNKDGSWKAGSPSLIGMTLKPSNMDTKHKVSYEGIKLHIAQSQLQATQQRTHEQQQAACMSLLNKTMEDRAKLTLAAAG